MKLSRLKTLGFAGALLLGTAACQHNLLDQGV